MSSFIFNSFILVWIKLQIGLRNASPLMNLTEIFFLAGTTGPKAGVRPPSMAGGTNTVVNAIITYQKLNFRHNL